MRKDHLESVTCGKSRAEIKYRVAKLIGKNVRKARKKRKLTAYDLERMIGYTAECITSAERAIIRNGPNFSYTSFDYPDTYIHTFGVHHLFLIAKALNCPISELLEGLDDLSLLD
jgi:transcriptional regulator with XRE-family HTH domain